MQTTLVSNPTATTDDASSVEVPIMTKTKPTSQPKAKKEVQAKKELQIEAKAEEKKPVILQYKSEDGIVLALDSEGRVPVIGFMVGHEFAEGEWNRADVIRKAEAAGIDPYWISGGRLNHQEEFRRSCRAVEKLEFEQGVQPVVVRLLNGRSVQINTYTRYEVVAVDGNRVGTVYQLNLRRKFFVKDIESTLAEGITKQDIITALGAKGDTDHEITQNVGKWRLMDNLELEATLYDAIRSDRTGVPELFERLTSVVRESFRSQMGVYTHADVKNAWLRTRGQMTGSFPFKMGTGGNSFVLAKYRPNLEAWKTFLFSLYAKHNFWFLPLANAQEAMEKVHMDGEEWLQREWDQIVDDTLEAPTKAKSAKTVDKQNQRMDEIRTKLEDKMRTIQDVEAEINRALTSEFAIRSRVSATKASIVRKEMDPRVKSLFYGSGLVEPDTDEEEESVERSVRELRQQPQIPVVAKDDEAASAPVAARRARKLREE